MKKQFLMGMVAMMAASSAFAALPTGADAPAKLLDSPLGLMAPVWSPDGSKIAVTTDNFVGILVANADGTGLRSLTLAPGTGYKMAWTADGKEVVGRTNIRDGKLMKHEICSWRVSDGKVTTLKSAFRGNAHSTMRAVGKKANLLDIMIEQPREAASMIDALNDYVGYTVINPTLSPDGSKIAFQLAGAGMWVINADGTGLKSLGKGTHPAWMPDSQSIVYTILTDDGAQFTSSTLLAMDIAANTSVTLTKIAGIIPMNPSVSPDGLKVAFENVADAAIYTINLKF